MTSIVVLRFARTPPPLCHSWKEFFFFCSGNGGGITRELFAILPATSRSIPVTGSEGGGMVSAPLTTNAADNKHHAVAKSLSMFETSTQKTDRRHPTPFPNTNEVECMPATSLHDLLDSMHNTLSQLQKRAGRACDIIYSLIRVRLDLHCWRWPVLKPIRQQLCSTCVLTGPYTNPWACLMLAYMLVTTRCVVKCYNLLKE